MVPNWYTQKKKQSIGVGYMAMHKFNPEVVCHRFKNANQKTARATSGA